MKMIPQTWKAEDDKYAYDIRTTGAGVVIVRGLKANPSIAPCQAILTVDGYEPITIHEARPQYFKDLDAVQKYLEA